MQEYVSILASQQGSTGRCLEEEECVSPVIRGIELQGDRYKDLGSLKRLDLNQNAEGQEETNEAQLVNS